MTSRDAAGDPAQAAETADERDRRWLRDVYRPDEPQLTVRAVATGMLLGGVLSAANLYVGLKIGWTFAMGITASLVSFGLFRALRPLGVRQLGLLETNTSQTAASAAAYYSASGLASAMPALAMLYRDGVVGSPGPSGTPLALWIGAVSVLGVVLAIPVKRALVNPGELRFPAGLACAESLRSLYASSEAAVGRARALFVAALASATWKALLEAKLGVFARVPALLAPTTKAAGYTLGLGTSVLLYGSGAIVGLRVAASMAGAALITFGVVGPYLESIGVLRVAPEGLNAAAWNAYRTAAEADGALATRAAAGLGALLRARWSVWPGTAMMVAASLTGLLLRASAVRRAFGALRGGARGDDPLAAVEIPRSWFLGGFALSGGACVVALVAFFGVSLPAALASIALAFLLALVAARVTGETGITPIGAMGKVAQLVFGLLVPGQPAANLMTANVTSGSAAHCADLLNEVKTGYEVGASPRKQLVAQLFGVLAGGLVCTPVYALLARPERLGAELPAPAAVAWAGVARVLVRGLDGVPRHALLAAAIAGGIGVVLATLEDRGPARLKPWLPSTTGIGVALVIDGSDSLAIFVGAVLGHLVTRARPDRVPLLLAAASGVIAGESVTGVLAIAIREGLRF